MYDQARAIRKNDLPSELELEAIKEKVKDDPSVKFVESKTQQWQQR